MPIDVMALCFYSPLFHIMEQQHNNNRKKNCISKTFIKILHKTKFKKRNICEQRYPKEKEKIEPKDMLCHKIWLSHFSIGC